METITQTKLAELAGVTKQMITKVMRAKPPQLTFVIEGGKKKIDLDGHLTATYLQGRTPKPQARVTAGPEKKRGRGRPLKIPEEPVNPYQDDGRTPSRGNNPSGTGDPGNLGLKDRKTQEEILRLEIANDQKRTTLILKESVTTLFGKIHAIDTNQFKTLGPNVNQQIDSIYNETNHLKAKKIVELFRSLLNIQGVKLEIKKETESEITKILETGSEDNKTEINRVMEDETGKILKNIQREIDDFIRANDELEVG